jgi:ABC-type lipoprotein export system ATPase subunit
MVTHDGEAAHRAERMMLLRDGKIIREKQGTHAMKKNTYAPIAEAP